MKKLLIKILKILSLSFIILIALISIILQILGFSVFGSAQAEFELRNDFRRNKSDYVDLLKKTITEIGDNCNTTKVGEGFTGDVVVQCSNNLIDKILILKVLKLGGGSGEICTKGFLWTNTNTATKYINLGGVRVNLGSNLGNGWYTFHKTNFVDLCKGAEN